MIDANTQVIGVPPRISLEKFAAVLAAAQSPALPEAAASYQAIVTEGVDPSFALAVFAHESNYGRVGICAKYSTCNPGNTRSSRTGAGVVIPTTERGSFVKYPDWVSGWRDLAYRLAEPGFDYAKAGAVTISQILPIFAPAKDGNDPAGYIAAVIKSMDDWIGVSQVAAPKPGNITWVGSPNHYNGRDGQSVVAIVDHIMVGTMESTAGWFNNPASQVSSTFGVAKDGRIAQYVALENSAWANGIPQSVDAACTWLVEAVVNQVNPNNLTVSIEHEGNSGDVMPEAQYQSTLALHRWLIGLYNIPVDRQHIIGHYQIMRFTKADCPGPGFPWPRLMADLEKGGLSHVADNQPPKPPTVPAPGADFSGTYISFQDPVTNYFVLGDFARYYQAHGGLEFFGRPVSSMTGGDTNFPDVQYYQFFERARFEWHPKEGLIMLGLVGAESMAYYKAKDAGKI